MVRAEGFSSSPYMQIYDHRRSIAAAAREGDGERKRTHTQTRATHDLNGRTPSDCAHAQTDCIAVAVNIGAWGGRPRSWGFLLLLW